MILLENLIGQEKSDLLVRLVFDRLSDYDVVKLIQHLIESNRLSLIERLSVCFDKVYWKAGH